MLTVDLKIKEWFFDRQAVIDRIGKHRAAFLKRVGGYAKRTAQNSLKRKGKARKPPKNVNGRAYERWQAEIRAKEASPAGTPPYTHTDSDVRTLRFILFAASQNNASVIVGPVGLRHKTLQANGGITPPALNEYGGSTPIHEKLQDVSPVPKRNKTGRRRFLTPAQKAAMIRRLKARGEYEPGNKWVPLGRGARPGQPVRTRNATYPARPFMGPAVAKTRSKFKDLWFTNREAMGATG